MKTQCWYLVRDAAKQMPGKKAMALYLWLEPDNGVIPTNQKGFPYGVPLRAVADRLDQLGIKPEKKGAKWWPQDIQERIDDAFPDAFAKAYGVELDPEQRHALKAAFVEGRRQKTVYTLDEEWETRCSWRLLKRPIRKRRPWGEGKGDDAEAVVVDRDKK